jgi:hypothetical protein
MKEIPEFSDVPDGAVFLRDIRHHDDHTTLNPQSLEANYMPVTVQDLRQDEYAPAPWTPLQARFATARQPVRLLKGHPGSGKTTALWHAADLAGRERVLYITYSRDLATVAREYFDRFCSSQKRFSVVTYSSLVAQICGIEEQAPALHEARQKFARDVAPFARSLGPWASNAGALFDELHAHLAGDALPVALGRFGACKHARVPDQAYRERRTKYIGQQAVSSALDVAGRLERLDSSSLASRYFHEVATAWRALEHMRGLSQAGRAELKTLFGFDCLAIDECQDLTPIETLLLLELVKIVNDGRRDITPLLLAGDEAQTVRPTDFEWGWLSDMLHATVGTPLEFKLTSNLRSPQRIAGLVNRVWDLYAHIQKQDRPSGTGYAEIQDDAADQIQYCTATPGPELNQLLIALSQREGLALVTLDSKVPSYVPEGAREAVLTVPEAKGLDFHSVCVLDAGRHLETVMRDNEWRADADVQGLRKRLAIDQLRVALSRPTERLFWLDISPNDIVVRHSLEFLNGRDNEAGVSAGVPAALLKALEEDELDPEERIQRCQVDARQFLQIKPEIAWSRAQQAVTLLGRAGSLSAVTDDAAREAAYLTLAEVCFILAIRNTRMAPELGDPNLFDEAVRAANMARRLGLGAILSSVMRVQLGQGEKRLQALAELAEILPRHKDQIEPWLMIELSAKATKWTEELEFALSSGRNAVVLIRLLPPFYEVLDIPDRLARTERLQQRAVQLLMKEKQFASALALLNASPEKQPKLEAACHEGLGQFREAAEAFLRAGSPKDAINSYRSIPDLAEALKLVGQASDHPAVDSLQWMSRLQDLIAERPEKFNKVVTAAEKKFLEELLERGLGVTRRKPAAKKTAVKKAVAPVKRTVKRTVVRKNI